jgi:hypothetical protein
MPPAAGTTSPAHHLTSIAVAPRPQRCAMAQRDTPRYAAVRRMWRALDREGWHPHRHHPC